MQICPSGTATSSAPQSRTSGKVTSPARRTAAPSTKVSISDSRPGPGGQGRGQVAAPAGSTPTSRIVPGSRAQPAAGRRRAARPRPPAARPGPVPRPSCSRISTPTVPARPWSRVSRTRAPRSPRTTPRTRRGGRGARRRSRRPPRARPCPRRGPRSAPASAAASSPARAPARASPVAGRRSATPCPWLPALAHTAPAARSAAASSADRSVRPPQLVRAPHLQVLPLHPDVRAGQPGQPLVALQRRPHGHALQPADGVVHLRGEAIGGRRCRRPQRSRRHRRPPG